VLLPDGEKINSHSHRLAFFGIEDGIFEPRDAVQPVDLTGDGGGKWYVDLTQSPGKVGSGSIDTPGVTITMTAADFTAGVNGKLNWQMAFMQGKLKIKGDMSLALKLQQILG